MKKKDIILITIIIILTISLIGTIYYYNKVKTITIEGEILAVGSNYLLVSTKDKQDYVITTSQSNYQTGDIVQLEINNIDKSKSPHEAKAKNIIILENNNNENQSQSEINTENNNNNQTNDNYNENLSINQNQNHQKEENYNEEQVIAYFENLEHELTTYDNDQTLSETIKTKFVKCIDFIFYDEEIGGKTFKELTNKAKLKILEITMSIDAKIESKFPGYKDSISSTYQNIKTKIIEKYLETTTNICNNDQELCQTAKEGFNNLKENFGITWDVIKDLTKNSVSKLKDWYEIWRYK